MSNGLTCFLLPAHRRLYLLLLAGLVIVAACNTRREAAAAPGLPVAPQAADTPVGGYCDGCELMYAGMPAVIRATDTSAGWREPGRKLLLTGLVVQKDGHTPAPDVIIYYWHTDDNGRYAVTPGMDRRAGRHGHIRGWLKTDSAGRYALYTIRPRAYPDQSEPEHIHIAIKEPGLGKEYYIDELVFDDDPLLAAAIRQRPRENRGGSGILNVSPGKGLPVAQHTIILGKNIPHYPR